MQLQLQAKGQFVPPATPQQSYRTATVSESNHVAQPAVQQFSSASFNVPESGVEAAEEGYGLEEEGLIFFYFCFSNFSLVYLSADLELIY